MWIRLLEYVQVFAPLGFLFACVSAFLCLLGFLQNVGIWSVQCFWQCTQAFLETWIVPSDEKWFQSSTLWISTDLYYSTLTSQTVHTSRESWAAFSSIDISRMHVYTNGPCLTLTDFIFPTHRGEMSQPCCMKAPRENHSELKMPNSLGGWSVGPCSVAPSSGSSACHSYGLKRLTWQRDRGIEETRSDHFEDHQEKSNGSRFQYLHLFIDFFMSTFMF